ncbi:MAG: hypothetical protein ACK5LM_04270 [Lactovum sp.]
MEARKYEDEIEETFEIKESINTENAFQEYVSIEEEILEKNKSIQKRELSFFGHVSSFCLLFMLSYPLFSSFIPFEPLSLILSLILPVLLIIMGKKLFKKYY